MLKSYVKLLACIAFVIAPAVTCSRPRSERYVIAASNKYEASLFRQNCSICHGPEADGRILGDGRQVPGLRTPPYKYRADAEIYRHIAEGGNGMVPFRGILTDREIKLMVDFVQNDLRRNNR